MVSTDGRRDDPASDFGGGTGGDTVSLSLCLNLEKRDFILRHRRMKERRGEMVEFELLLMRNLVGGKECFSSIAGWVF